MTTDAQYPARNQLDDLDDKISSAPGDPALWHTDNLESSLLDDAYSFTSLPYSTMQVFLDNHYRARVYNPGDAITGHVRIIAHKDTAFDDCEIVLLGTAHSCVNAVSGPLLSTHTFLKVRMPLADTLLPQPPVFQAGLEYTVPFHFVVPAHLTLGACSHTVQSDIVRGYHTSLPPTLGSRSDTTSAKWDRDDMTPDMARVEYAVRARLLQATYTTISGTVKVEPVLEASHAVRILPIASVTSASFPAADIHSLHSPDGSYTLTKSKSLRKGLLMPLLRTSSSKLGTVQASIAPSIFSSGFSSAQQQQQPPLLEPVVLSADGRAATPTAIHVDLHFDPTASASPPSPPRVTEVSAKLIAHTYYSIGPISSLPTPGSWSQLEGLMNRAGYHTMSVSLRSADLDRCAKDLQWEPQVMSALRRDSGYGSEDGESHADGYDDGKNSSSATSLSYATRLVVPIELPLDRRAFVPTFHSCIMSRTYSLRLNISVAPVSVKSSMKNSSANTTTLTLTVPLEIVASDHGASSRSSQTLAVNGLPSFDTAVEEAEADAFLQPRTISVPEAQFQQTSFLPTYGRR